VENLVAFENTTSFPISVAMTAIINRLCTSTPQQHSFMLAIIVPFLFSIAAVTASL